ncbi:diacylglycerol kinase [Colwellia asteriadis]|uniref:diacylglycerol kinase n=1 Tax=Colwellia asteriadis TaxID=517723 RepID=UPI0031D7A728
MQLKTNKPNGSGGARIVKATYCSFLGFKAAFKHEAAFRQELLLCVILLPFSFIVAATLTQWLLLIFTLAFLLFAEIINSAIEALADRISLEHHELIGRAKDLGSAGVFIAMFMVVLVWSATIIRVYFW